ncbi:MAG TPA: ABC transporter permease [Candidatus Saccharimonadales bacterium]|nr:ABC transporter permease [Candidatus Saccharimonadales bacterium]
MRIVDAYILARTKRKTRRIRTALVTVVSALLFAVLFFGAFIAAGVVQGANEVKDVGFNSRYLTSILSTGRPAWNYDEISNKIYAQMDAELRAKKVTVDQNTHNDPSYMAEYTRRLSGEMGAKDKEALKRFEESLPGLGKPTATYHLRGLALNEALTHHENYQADPKVKRLETFAETKAEPEDKDPLTRMEFYSAEKDMLRTQLAPGQTFDWQPGQPVPLILPYPYLERLAGRSFANIDAATKNAAYKELIAAYSGKILNYCHRTTTAQQQLQDVVAYNHDAAKDKDKTTNPIAIPVCGDFDQKLLKKLGIISEPATTEPKPLFAAPALPAPKTTRVEFKIVGFIPGQDQYNTDLLTSIFSGVTTFPAVPNPAIIPREVAVADAVFTIASQDVFRTQEFLFVDFASRDDQKAFLTNGCQGDECNSGSKPFMQPFGNLSVALEGIYRVLVGVVLGAVVAMMIIAALMILFTISKVIADSTKEVAVFRALGARRRDIAQIYYTYGCMLAVSALLFAGIIGATGAYAANVAFGDRFAATLVQSVGAYTQNPTINLIGVEPIWLLGVTGALLLAAMIGITIPVLAALKRKLITILREE